LHCVGVPEIPANRTMQRSGNMNEGDKAKAFNLPDQDGKKHKLSDYKGKWVVLFAYPKADTPG
jgi:peroxiredoxin